MNRNLVYGVQSHRTGRSAFALFAQRLKTSEECDTRGNDLCLRYIRQMSQIHFQYNNSTRDFGRFIPEIWHNSFTIQKKCVTIHVNLLVTGPCASRDIALKTNSQMRSAQQVGITRVKGQRQPQLNRKPRSLK